jgi:starch synthase
MNLLFVTGELSPINGDTGRGHNIANLGGALCLLGHKVRVCTPVRDLEIINRYSLARRLTPLKIELPNGDTDLHVYGGKLPNGIEMWLVDSETYFRGRPALTADEDEPLRHALLAQAALLLAQEECSSGDWHILHSFGLPGSLTSALKDRFPATKAAKAVFSPETFEHQGRCKRDWVERLGLSWDDFTPDRFEYFGDLNLLKAGLVSADQVLLDSPAQLLESCTAAGGQGLDGVMRHRRSALATLLPGLDYARWNPATDVDVVAHFDAEQRAGKLSCKAQLQHQLGLPVRPLPVIVLSPPLNQLGSALAHVVDRIARQPVHIVVPEGLDGELQKALDELSKRLPRQVATVKNGQTNWHSLLAGADLVVMDPPATDGAERLLATLRYGALPVVPASGVARDLVVDLTNTLDSGNGFIVQGAEPREVQAVLERALAALRYGKVYEEVQRRAMSVACSWEQRAQQLEQLYGQLLPPAPPTKDSEEDAESCASAE